MNTQNPLVSVVIPTYNREKVIDRAVTSVLKQTYTNWELVIVDDGSTDNTRSVLSKYKTDERITVFSCENKGVCAARNFGMKKAQGDFFCLLDSDDEFYPKKLSVQLEKMEEFGALFSITNCIKVKNNNFKEPIKQSTHVFDRFLDKSDIIEGKFSISASLMLFHKSIFDQVSFDEILPTSNDTDFLLRSMTSNKVLLVDSQLVIIHKDLNGNRISTNPIKKVTGFEMILNKNQKNTYQLNLKESELFKERFNKELALFYLLVGESKQSRETLRKIKTFSLYNVILYLFAFLPVHIIKLAIYIAKKLWTFNLIKV